MTNNYKAQLLVFNKNMHEELKQQFYQDHFLVINTDDFGLSSEITDAIFKAHEKGTLTSTSLKANGPMFRQALLVGQLAPSLGVGVHLEKTLGLI